MRRSKGSERALSGDRGGKAPPKGTSAGSLDTIAGVTDPGLTGFAKAAGPLKGPGTGQGPRPWSHRPPCARGGPRAVAGGSRRGDAHWTASPTLSRSQDPAGRGAQGQTWRRTVIGQNAACGRPPVTRSTRLQGPGCRPHISAPSGTASRLGWQNAPPRSRREQSGEPLLSQLLLPGAMGPLCSLLIVC